MGVMIRRDTVDYPATATAGESVYSGSSTSFVDGSLVDYTTYYYSAFSNDGQSVPNPTAAKSKVIPPGWAKTAAGTLNGLAIRNDGALWAWGDNGSGQLGIGATSPDLCTNFSNSGSSPSPCTRNPMRVGSATTWSSVIAGGAHSLALQNGGTLWAWGDSQLGQLGDGSTDNRDTPKQIGTEATWSAISAGTDHSIALQSDGTLLTWGGNGWGQMGVGNAGGGSNSPTPIPTGTAAVWSVISGGGYFSLALQSDGTLWAWGRNGFGQLGDGTTEDRHAPEQIRTATSWFAIAAGHEHSLALRTTARSGPGDLMERANWATAPPALA